MVLSPIESQISGLGSKIQPHARAVVPTSISADSIRNYNAYYLPQCYLFSVPQGVAQIK